MAQDILITPGSGEPQILFRGSGTNDTPIELNVLSSYQSATGSGSALLFEGEQGQLFAITDNLSSGVIFSVSDITGLPAIEYNASGELKLGEFSSVLIYDNSSSIGNSGQLLASTGDDVVWINNPSGALQSQVTQNADNIASVSGLLDDYVPYVGSTQSLNLGNNALLLSGVQALSYTNYGYSPTYKAVQIGLPSTYSSTVALCVNVNSIAGGNFAAQNQVIIPPNGFLFPNASNSDFIGVLSRSNDDKLLIGTTLQAGKAAGNIVVDTDGDIGIGTASPGAQLHLVNNTASDIGSVVQGAAAQSANLQEWQNSSATKLLAVGPDGGLEIPNNVPSSTTNKLYNNNGDLYFNGSAVGGSGGGGGSTVISEDFHPFLLIGV